MARYLALLFLCAPALAQPPVRAVPLDYYLPADTAYDSKVPVPEAFFGFQVGDWHLRTDQVNGYLQAVAAAVPERVKVRTIGRSYEDKPLLLVTITAPENHARLDEIRARHLAAFDPAQTAPADSGNQPVIVNLGYTVHGNEASGINAAVLVVYHLAAAQSAEHLETLRRAVVLVEPVRNPDGSDRAAQWFNQHRSLSGPSSDPNDREHLEAWPRGRFNHYFFDANRDWLPLVHPEAQARADLFHQWRPHVLTDHHEMGSNNTYFFQPGVPTRNNPAIPAEVIELTGRIAAFHQRAFDARGIYYYSEQGFDDFYPGKGSTYPDLHGSIGILFEQASSRGHLMETDNGLLSFPFTIRNQVITSFSTLDAAIALRPELLRWQRQFPRATAELAAKSATRAYVFGDDGDPARAWALRDVLARHRIEVRPLTAEVATGTQTFRPGAAWVVRVDQPQFRLVQEIFGRRTQFQDNIFYDVSAWTLPLAYNLPHAALDKLPPVGEPASGSPGFPLGRLVGGHSAYAYVLPWNGYYAARALHRLHQAKIQVKALTGASVEATAADGTRVTFAPGAILVPVGAQPEKAAQIRSLVDTIVNEDAINVYGFATGLTPRGVDFGSPAFVPLAPAKVALIVGQGVDPQTIGAAWHVLDQRVALTPTLLDLAQLPRTDLARYNVIVFADGTYDEVSDATLTTLKRWVRDGGTLLVQGRAMQWATRKEIAPFDFASAPAPAATTSSSAAAAPAAAAGPATPAAPPRRTDTPAPSSSSATTASTEPPAPARVPYGSGVDREALRLLAGAIFAASVDVTHPLGYGFNGERLALCRRNTTVLKPAKSPYETPVVYTAEPLLSGYVSDTNRRQIASSAAAVALPVGSGAVVALPDDPNFRGMWYGGNRLFFNAVFHGRAIKPIGVTLDGAADANHDEH